MKNTSYPGNSLESATKGTKKQPYHKSEAVKYLEYLSVEAKKRKYPNIPPDYIRLVKYNDSTANGLTKCIIDFLRIKEHQAERINTTGRMLNNTKIVTDILGRQRLIGSLSWIKGNTTTGSADISATINSLSVKIEVKIYDSQSLAQKDYQRTIESAGGIYFIAKNFTDFVTWYNQNF